MAAPNARRFVYEIQAAYTGQSSIQQLQRDLNALGSAQGYQDAVDNFAELTEQVAAAEAQVTALNAALAAAPGDSALVEALEAAVAQQGELQQQMEESFDTVNEAAASMNEYGLALEDVEGQIGALEHMVQQAGTTIAAQNLLGLPDPQDVQNQIQALQQAYQTLQNTPGVSSSQLAQAHLNMLQQTQALEQSTHNWSAALAQARHQILALAGAFAAVGKGVQMAIEFEQNMAEVRKTVGGTKEEIAALGVELRNLSMRTGFSPGELAEIAAIGGQLGVAREEIADFVKTASTMGTAFDMAAGKAGDAVAKLGNVFQIPLDGVERLGDAINQLGNNTAARERDIVNVMLRIGGASRQFGLAEKNAAALAATMLSLGRAPEVAGTAINAMLTKLQAAGAQPKRFQEALARLGIQAKNLAQQIQDNPQKALDELLETLSRLQGAERTEILTGLFGAEFGDDVGILVGSLDTYRQALRQVGDEAKYAGAMAEEARNKNDTTAHALAVLGETLSNIWTTVGEGFRPAIEAAAKAAIALLQPVAEFLAESPKMAAWTVGIVGLTAAMRPLVYLFSTLRVAALAFWSSMGGATAAAGGVSLLTTQLSLATIRAAGLRAALSALGGVTSIATLAWQVGSFLQTLEPVRIAVQKMFASWHAGLKAVQLAWAKVFGTADEVRAIERELQVIAEMYENTESDIRAESAATAAQKKRDREKETADVKANLDAQVNGNDEALKEMAAAYKRYVEEVRRLQEDISGRQKSLAAELREMGRTGMSGIEAWNDLKREAEEYAAAAKKAAEEAKQAAASGDTIPAAQKWKEAVQYADDARRSYRQLNTEVKDGDQVVISKAKALETAMAGVKAAGELGVSILKQQQEEAYKAMDALEKDSGMAGLISQLDEAEQKWLLGWQNMRAASLNAVTEVNQAVGEVSQMIVAQQKEIQVVEAAWASAARSTRGLWIQVADELKRKIDAATKPRTVTVYTNVVQGRRWGGLIGDAARFARGGKLPGYGGGDRISALLEAGEFIVRKEAVRKFGAGFFSALNSLKLPPLPDFSAFMPATAAAGGAGGSARTVNINLTLPSGDTYQLTADQATAARIEREQERWWALRSGNKVKKSAFARTR